jgi:hypothetical protein
MALRDGGQRLRAAIEDNAAELVAALQALAAAGCAEPPWNTAAFQGAALRFIDAEGRPQARAHACMHGSPPSPPSLLRLLSHADGHLSHICSQCVTW